MKSIDVKIINLFEPFLKWLPSLKHPLIAYKSGWIPLGNNWTTRYRILFTIKRMKISPRNFFTEVRNYILKIVRMI